MRACQLAIIGAGSWGTALALHLAKKGVSVCLWDKNTSLVEAMQSKRHNPFYLSQFVFPETLQVAATLEEAVTNSQDVLIATPSHALDKILVAISPHLILGSRILIVAKGIEPTTHTLLHSLVEKHFSKAMPFAILSGPSFAAEVAVGMPTAVVIAGNNEEFRQDMVALFRTPFFRLYDSSDYIGVQLGGAVKNVLAIAVGISDGLGYGANMRAALITFGMQEMMQLGLAMGAKVETFMGLSGIGDLVLTCTDSQSRNRRFGLALGQGCSVEVAEQSIGQSVEGKGNAYQIAALSRQYHVAMPIVSLVLDVLSEKETAEKEWMQWMTQW